MKKLIFSLFLINLNLFGAQVKDGENRKHYYVSFSDGCQTRNSFTCSLDCKISNVFWYYANKHNVDIKRLRLYTEKYYYKRENTEAGTGLMMPFEHRFFVNVDLSLRDLTPIEPKYWSRFDFILMLAEE